MRLSKLTNIEILNRVKRFATTSNLDLYNLFTIYDNMETENE